MELIRYFVIALAVVDFILLFVRPRLGFLGLILLLPFVNRFIGRAGPALNAETFLFAAAIGGILLHERRPLPPLSAIGPFAYYYAMVFFGFAMLVTWPEFKGHGGDLGLWAKAVKANLWPTLLFFIAYALTPSRTSRRVALNFLVVGVFLFAITGLSDFSTGGEHHRAAGILGANPNMLGGSLAAFCFIPLMTALDRKRPQLMRLFGAGVYALSLLVIVFTQSRGSWLAFVIGHSVWLFLTNRKLLLPAIVTGAVVLVVGYSASLLPAIIGDRIEATFTPGQRIYQSGGLAGKLDSSIDVRIAYHAMGAEMFMDSPLYGHGYRSFPLLTREYGLKYGVWRNRSRQTSAESMLLMITADHGLMGYAGVLWMSWMLLSRAMALRRRGGEDAAFGTAFIAGFFAVLMSAGTQNALLIHEIALPFYLSAGLMVRTYYDRVPEVAPEPDLMHSPIIIGELQPHQLGYGTFAGTTKTL